MVKLKKWMTRTRKSQAQLARELGVSRSLVCHWMRGDRMPGRGKLKTISQLTGLKIEDLL
jgi:transcriptional regulator with XRE-family HTH domain